MRVKRALKTDVDLSQPVDVSLFLNKDDSTCFGKEWDMSFDECRYCADNEVCGVLFSNELKNKVGEVEKDTTTFLDLSDFKGISEEDVLTKIDKMTSLEFVALIKSLANTDDDVAVVQWIKRFVNARGNVSIKNNIVYVKRDT